MSSVQLEPAPDAERWTAAAQASGQPVTAFHAYPWLVLAAGLTGTSFTPLVVCADGADVGIAPCLTRHRGPFRTVNWVPFPYAGPLVPAGLLEPTVRALEARASRLRTVRHQLCFPPGADVDTSALAAHGFAVRMDRTYQLDTGRDLEALWAGLTSRTRGTIRRTARAGVTITEAGDTGVLGEVVRAIFEAHKIGGFTRFPPTMDEINGLGFPVRIAVAWVEGTPVGCLSTFIHGTRAIGWQGGVFPRYRKTNANVVLYWDAISWAHREGATELDFGGVPDEGVNQFKRQFGGRLVEYPVAVRSSRLWRAAGRVRWPGRRD